MHILHIAHRREWEEACRTGVYGVSTRGATVADVGFIHCAASAQVAAVGERYYADDPEELVVLVMSEATITAAGTRVMHEDGGDGELYPHIYGPIDPAWVVETRPARIEEGRFVVAADST